MELLETILVSLLVGASASLMAVLGRALLHLVTHVIEVGEQAQVSVLDRHLAEAGWCSSRHLSPGRLPAAGVHFAFLRGPVIAHRTSTKSRMGGTDHGYKIYAIGSSAAVAIAEKLTGNPRDVIVRYVYAPAPWRTSTVTMRCSPPLSVYRWQEAAIDTIVCEYRMRDHASALVCGGMGIGKSTLGELIAVQLKKTLKVSPEVIKNFDLTSKGLLLEDGFDTPTPNSPIILMLDEFDTTVDCAENSGQKEGDAREGASLADTPTTLLALLDRLNRTPNLIVIATSNKGVTEMAGGAYARYTRKGRLDLHIPADTAK
jgi:hypothetical protein